MTRPQIRVLIADDQVLFAEGLKTILESRADDIKVIALASNGEEAVAMAREHRPDIILMDVRMPVMDGVDATRSIRGFSPGMRIVMLTTFSDDDYVKYSLAAGAIGYLLKNRPPAELIASIRAVMGGVLQIDPGVSAALIRTTDAERLHADDDFLRYLNTLTRRERDVLRLLVQANDNRQISEKLQIAEQTVKNYISIIYGKLGITNRIEIMRYMDKVEFYLEHN